MSELLLLIGTKRSGLAYLAMLLEQAGYQTRRCFDVRQLDWLLRERQPDLVIIDDQPPDLAAEALYAEMVTTRQELTNTPFVLLSQSDKSHNGSNASGTPAFRVLPKPILPHRLLNLIEQIVTAERRRDEA